MNWLLTLVFVHLALALHFYLNTGESRCFYEELQADTLLVGRIEATERVDGTNDYRHNGNLKVKVTVDETFDNDHRVLDQKLSSSGEFTFTTQDLGEHLICITPEYIDGTNNKRHKVYFDLAQGSAHDFVDSKGTKKVDDLTTRIKALNQKLTEIHNEQENLRIREATFRDQSELTNARVVKWSIIQLIVLVGTCVYQLRHLKSFFVKQKIV